MIKNVALVVLSLSMIISLVANFKIIRQFKMKSLEKNRLEGELADMEYLEKRRKIKFEQNLFSEAKVLDDVYLYSSSEDSILLSKAVNNGTNLVYRFYEESCNQCIEDELDIVKELGAKIGYDRILLIGQFSNVNHLRAMVARKNIQSPLYNFPRKFKLPFDQDVEAIPSFFLLHKDLQTDFVYKAGGAQNFNFPYFKRIVEIFTQLRQIEKVCLN